MAENSPLGPTQHRGINSVHFHRGAEPLLGTQTVVGLEDHRMLRNSSLKILLWYGRGAPGITHPTSKETKCSHVPAASKREKGEEPAQGWMCPLLFPPPSHWRAVMWLLPSLQLPSPLPPWLTRSQPHWLPCFSLTMLFPTSGPLHLLPEAHPQVAPLPSPPFCCSILSPTSFPHCS